MVQVAERMGVAYRREMDRKAEVVGVGHAIVDVLAPATDDLVTSLGLAKGTMALVDDERSAHIFEALGSTTASSGGSAANTCAGLASLGAAVAFIGKVRDDDLGRAFGHDIRRAGVDFDVDPATGGAGTGRCVVLVTPDAERTMCTSLGIGDHLGPDDIDEDLIRRSRVLYLEGYLCGLDATDATIDRALEAASAGHTEVALSLSDPYWVATHGGALERVLGQSQIVFANEAEASGLTGATDVEAAVAALAERCATVVVTRGAAGSIVAEAGRVTHIPAEAVRQVVDTTGAGDLFAAGYLFGHARGLDPRRSARLGARCAAEVIAHFGARPEVSLAALADDGTYR